MDKRKDPVAQTAERALTRLYDHGEGITPWEEINICLHDARALLAKLNGVQFADLDERLKVVAEVSEYLAGGDSNASKR